MIGLDDTTFSLCSLVQACGMHLPVKEYLPHCLHIIYYDPAAFLPSSFAMYTTALAYAYAFEPSSSSNKHRTLAATLLFATGAIVGWPFALALAIPFVFEELFVYGADIVTPQNRPTWMSGRFRRLFSAGLAATLIFVCSSILIVLNIDLHTADPSHCH